MGGEAAYLVVARFIKPHGLKGEAQVVSMTDEPAEVFVPGRVLLPVDEDGTPVGDEVAIARARPFQRRWLLAFRGMDDRTAVEEWGRGVTWLGAAAAELRPPKDDELYVHEIPGCAVLEDGVEIGRAKALMGPEGGELLVVERQGREHLIPFRQPIVERVERATRRIHVRLPAGLLEMS